MCLDSSNIQPEEWVIISRAIFEARDSYDGIVVSHGTDTMAYTASMATFMLENINIPVVFTGSQLPWPIFCPTGRKISAPPLPWPLPGSPAYFWASTGKSCWAAGPSRSALRDFPPLKASTAVMWGASRQWGWSWMRLCCPISQARPVFVPSQPPGLPPEADPGVDREFSTLWWIWAIEAS